MEENATLYAYGVPVSNQNNSAEDMLINVEGMQANNVQEGFEEINTNLTKIRTVVIRSGTPSNIDSFFEVFPTENTPFVGWDAITKQVVLFQPRPEGANWVFNINGVKLTNYELYATAIYRA